ncbi:putative odorant receptor 69a [Drosophila elegans]|uniref:putative odorant receptor 69a n=1 Tax=Drosophila elegans TaxID=30023 RepID=UPI0007E88DC5|nr:putative odorant receptor 69a [Drosophila elegans]
MQLHDYMKYIDRGCWMGLIPRYQWSGRPTDRKPYRLEQKALFVLAVICAMYQIFGVIIYWYRNGRLAEDTSTFVTEISEMCGSLMLTTVGFGNIYALIKPRNLIENMFEELEEIYPSQSDEHYRCQLYYDLAMAIMKIEFMFYMVFYAYYNSAPVLLLLWENLQEGQELSFKTQTNTWFPWKVHGSALGFGGAVLCLILGSFVGVGFSIATQNLIVIFTFQLKLHYDGLESKLLHLDSRQPNANQQLRDLIAYHSRILHIGDQFNHILNFVFGTSLVGSTIAICMLSVAISLLDAASAIKYVSGLTAFVLYHFVICYMGTEVTFAYQMQLEDFMRYPDLVCWVAQLPRIEWSGRRCRVNRTLAQRFFFWFGALNLVYHNIGLIMCARFVDGSAMDPFEYVSELTDIGAMLGFTTMGTLNLWKIMRCKPEIEKLMEEFEALFQQAKKRSYRIQHYYEAHTRLIKKSVRFYAPSICYYNLLPIILMVVELLTDNKQLSYRIQSSAWYPWKVHGSFSGFFAAVVCQAFSCQIDLGIIIFTQFLISFFGIQLEIQFDGLARQLEAIDARHPAAKEQLKHLLAYHIKLFNLADRVNHSLNFTFCVSFTVSILSMCFQGISVIMGDLGPALKHMLGLFVFLVYNFSICRNGTHISIASDKVMPAAFYNNWYEGDLAYRKMILILMIRATKPYMWRTYKLAPVSITTYMATLKLSYQIFTCVRSLK